MPRMWDWVYLGRAIGDAAQYAGDSMDAAAAQEAERRRIIADQADLLISVTTEQAHMWANLLESLLYYQAYGLDDEDADEFRRDTVQNRIDALGVAARLRAVNIENEVFKPTYADFLDMAEIHVGICDAILKACESKNPDHLEYAISSARLCQSICERLLTDIPLLAEIGGESDSASWKGCGCAAIVILAVLIGSLAWICD